MWDVVRARKEGRAPSGNGRRESYRHLPMPRMTNTFVLEGATDPDDIIRSVDFGIYCVQLGGGQVDPATGDFAFGVTAADLIEKGEGKRTVRPAQLIRKGLDVVEDTLQEARGNAGFGAPDEWYGLASPADVDGISPPDLDLWRDELASVPTEEKVRIALDLERATKAADSRIRNVESASYGDALAEAALANSLGVEAQTRRTPCSASAVALAADGSAPQPRYPLLTAPAP